MIELIYFNIKVFFYIAILRCEHYEEIKFGRITYNIVLPNGQIWRYKEKFFW